MEFTDIERKIKQIDEIGAKVNNMIVAYHCDDGYNEEEAKKLYKDVEWMMCTPSYCAVALGYIELMYSSLDLILEPHVFKQKKNCEDRN